MSRIGYIERRHSRDRSAYPPPDGSMIEEDRKQGRPGKGIRQGATQRASSAEENRRQDEAAGDANEPQRLAEGRERREGDRGRVEQQGPALRRPVAASRLAGRRDDPPDRGQDDRRAEDRAKEGQGRGVRRTD